MNDELTKRILNQLTEQEKIILADFWEGEARGALEKLFGQRQLQLAQQVLKSSADHYYTTENRGRANELTEVTRLLSQNLKQQNNKRAELSKPAVM